MGRKGGLGRRKRTERENFPLSSPSISMRRVSAKSVPQISREAMPSQASGFPQRLRVK